MGLFKKALDRANIEGSEIRRNIANRDVNNVQSVKGKNKQPSLRSIENKVAVKSREIRVRYSTTRVQKNDPQMLKERKIFTLFDNFSTTNQIKFIRTQILKKMKALGGNSLLITSANPYEGKTTTSINLGVSIARELDRTVLIIDADLVSPTKKHRVFCKDFFNLRVKKGLSDFLKGNANIGDIFINPGIDKLTIIPSGESLPNSSELLNSGKMELMMTEIKNRYPSDRFVIIDGPAFLKYPDAMIMSRYVEGVLIVIESEKTSASDLKEMSRSMDGIPIIGTVLNKVPKKK
jgi:non-specific protein-tyrosine kinase